MPACMHLFPAGAAAAWLAVWRKLCWRHNGSAARVFTRAGRLPHGQVNFSSPGGTRSAVALRGAPLSSLTEDCRAAPNIRLTSCLAMHAVAPVGRQRWGSEWGALFWFPSCGLGPTRLAPF